jgi:hypothetical protein
MSFACRVRQTRGKFDLLCALLKSTSIIQTLFFFKTLIFQFWSNWVAGWLGVEDKLVQWFGLDQSKYQWAIDEYMDRQLVSFSLHDLSLSLSLLCVCNESSSLDSI